jgi:hypothetical protein
VTSFRQKAEDAAAKAVAREQALAKARKNYAPDGEAQGIELEEWGPIAGQLADFATTTAALRKPGVREGNPVLVSIVKQPLLFLALKTGVGALMGKAVDRLNDQAGRLRLQGEPAAAAKRERVAKVAGAFLTLIGAGPAISNARLMRKR